MAKVKSFVLSDESINTYGFRLLMTGAGIEQFRKNPVMFYNHDWSSPIGRWDNIRIEDGKLLADAVFDDDDELGKKIAGKVERGFLRAASIALRIMEQTDDPKLMIAGQKLPTVSKWEAREASVVPIGSNHNALRLYDANDNLIPESEIFQLFDKLIEQKPMNEEILKLLDVPQGGTEEQIQLAVKSLVDTNIQLKQELKVLKDAETARETADNAARSAQAVKLVDEAVREGKLTAEGKEEFLKFFNADHDSAVKALANIPKRVNVTKVIERAAEGNNSELSALNAKTWDELDRSGKLTLLKDKYPDVFAEKFEEKYGRKPSQA